MTNSQLIAVTTVLGLGLAFTPAAWADPSGDACAALVEARSALYSMISAKDKSAQDALNAKVQAASTKLDSALARMTGADAKLAAVRESLLDGYGRWRRALEDLENLWALGAWRSAAAEESSEQAAALAA